MLIAGPNLTIDRTLAIGELRPGQVLRFDRVVVTPGGKGLNVARAARALGHPALLVAFLPGHTGRAAAAMIAEEGVELSGVPTAGELRSTAVVQERGGRTTVVDAAGETLLRALDAAPDLVTPNLSEAEGALGLAAGGAAVESGADAKPRALAAAEALLRQGAEAAVVTADAAGAAVVGGGEAAEFIPAPRVAEVRNPIGAGDVLLSALATGLERGEGLLDAARAGVAAAAASVESPTAGELDPARARELAAVMARAG